MPGLGPYMIEIHDSDSGSLLIDCFRTKGVNE